MNARSLEHFTSQFCPTKMHPHRMFYIRIAYFCRAGLFGVFYFGKLSAIFPLKTSTQRLKVKFSDRVLAHETPVSQFVPQQVKTQLRKFYKVQPPGPVLPMIYLIDLNFMSNIFWLALWCSVYMISLFLPVIGYSWNHRC